MIELIYKDLCDGCGTCVQVCPTNTLTLGADGLPAIGNQSACQTCFMCELYCQSDALYVDPDCEQPRTLDPEVIRNSGLLGQFRRDSGWHEWADHPRYANLHWKMDAIFGLARATDGGRDKPAEPSALP